MSKKFLVNGAELICVDETKFDDVRRHFKENVCVDDLEGWESKEPMEMYNASIFIDEARYYSSLSPPDLVQAAEKTWFSAVYAVKEAYLSCGGIDLKSHKSLTFFCRFALHHAGLQWKRFDFLLDCWVKAEKMHQDAYGSENFSPIEYSQIIDDVGNFVLEFARFDRNKLWDEFNKSFIKVIDPDVHIKKSSCYVKLGGNKFNCKYSVFV